MEWDPGCAIAQDSNVTLTVDATDPDGDDSLLVYSGDLLYCSPGIGPGEISTLTCNATSVIDGTIIVTDIQQNEGSLPIYFVMCEDSEI